MTAHTRVPLQDQITALERATSRQPANMAHLRAALHTLRSAGHWRKMIIECDALPSLSPDEQTLFDAIGG